MPEISILGWFHTGIAIIALIAGLNSMVKYRFINSDQQSGKIYLLCTLIAAATALMIYQRGEFGPAHALAILTLLALAGGLLAEKKKFLGKLSPYFQAVSYTGTFLFHMIPAITDGLMRLPVDAPIVTDFEDPFLRGFYLAFFVIYLIVVTRQILLLRKQSSS